MLLNNTNILLAQHLIYVHVLQTLQFQSFSVCVELELIKRANLFGEISGHRARHFLLKREHIQKRKTDYQWTTLNDAWRQCLQNVIWIKSNFYRVQPSTVLLSMNLKLRQCVSAKIKVTRRHPYMFEMFNKCTCVLAKYKTQYSGPNCM